MKSKSLHIFSDKAENTYGLYNIIHYTLLYIDLKPQASNSTSSLCSNLDQNPENMALSTEDKNSAIHNVNTTLTSGARCVTFE